MNKTKTSPPASESFVKEETTKLGIEFDQKLKSTESSLKTEILALKIDLDLVKTELKDFRNDFNQKYDKLMNILDGLAGQFKRFDQEQTILSHKSSDHEDRIGKLERSVFATN